MAIDLGIANKLVDFVHEQLQMLAIVCDSDGVIVAARVKSRIGTVHTGALRRSLGGNHPTRP